MNHGFCSKNLIRGALAGVALGAVLFLVLSGGLHVHVGDAGDDCEICFQLDHVGLDIPALTPDGFFDSVDRMPALDASPYWDLNISGEDPARAPPVLS